MYLALKKKTRLHREDPCVVAFSADDGGKLRFVHPVYAVLLALCDGQRTRADLEQMAAEVFSMPPERARTLGERLATDFDDLLEMSEGPRPVEARYDPVQFLYEPRGNPQLKRVSTPLFVAWLVTERCVFDCTYCCIRTLPPAPRPTSELTTEQALAFVQDMIRTGVAAVTFHGGEPFLRRDVPDLIAPLVDAGIHVAASTKLRLSDSTVQRLAAAGLEELQVSLDSPDPAIAEDLVGRPGFFGGVLHNLETLPRHGIEPKVNTVVTARNLDRIPELIRFLHDRGVRRISLSGYLRSFWKHDDSLLPDPADLHRLDAQATALEAELEGLEITMCPLEDPRDSSLAKPGLAACSGGTSGLVVGSDGRVGICDRLLAFDDALVGNVTRSTLAEIWNGEALGRFITPDPASFTGTQCEGCGRAADCDRRVRCYYRSQMVDGRLFGPDYLCPATPPPPVRFF